MDSILLTAKNKSNGVTYSHHQTKRQNQKSFEQYQKFHAHTRLQNRNTLVIVLECIDNEECPTNLPKPGCLRRNLSCLPSTYMGNKWARHGNKWSHCLRRSASPFRRDEEGETIPGQKTSMRLKPNSQDKKRERHRNFFKPTLTERRRTFVPSGVGSKRNGWLATYRLQNGQSIYYSQLVAKKKSED